jgi:hypothetical protein
MPQVELCNICWKRVNDTEQWIVVTRAHEQSPGEVAHAECYQKRMADLR